jgi:hypothetical protein
MKDEYDLSAMKPRKNPYASKLKKSVTMRLGEDVISYFKSMAEESGVPYQSLINLYLRDCVATHKKLISTGMRNCSLNKHSHPSPNYGAAAVNRYVSIK